MRKIPLGNLNSNNPIKTSVKKYHASVARQSPRERNRLLACKNFAFTHANVHLYSNPPFWNYSVILQITFTHDLRYILE